MLSIGDSISETYRVDAELVKQFAQVVQDFNPLHLDEEAARASRFGRPIVHGTLVMSFISGLLGQRLPGPGSVYLVQHSEFRAPVYVGDLVTVSVTVEQIFSNGVARLSHQAMVGERLAVTGYSDVLLAHKAKAHE